MTEQTSGELPPSEVSEDMWEELKGQTGALLARLDERDFNAAAAVIQQLNDVRDNTLYREVGKLTRGLHDAIVNFDIAPAVEGQEPMAESQMANAKDRLDYVINLTQQSADKTMDRVEEGIPIAGGLKETAEQLRVDWHRLIRREMPADEFRGLAQRIDHYLESSVSGNALLGQKLNEILLAQDFQDLTGQVIKKVIALVQDVEDRLVKLMRVAGQVEELTGVVSRVEAPVESVPELDSAAEGPQIHADQRDDVVSGQDDVDDLLSSLGF